MRLFFSFAVSFGLAIPLASQAASTTAHFSQNSRPFLICKSEKGESIISLVNMREQPIDPRTINIPGITVGFGKPVATAVTGSKKNLARHTDFTFDVFIETAATEASVSNLPKQDCKVVNASIEGAIALHIDSIKKKSAGQQRTTANFAAAAAATPAMPAANAPGTGSLSEQDGEAATKAAQ